MYVFETGLLKEGEKSVSVARPYTGTAGRTENSQVGVFAVYASYKGAALWTALRTCPKGGHRKRSAVAKSASPKVCFATKGELARRRMLERAFEAGVPARWVVADTAYGTARGLRSWLEERGRSYVKAVTGAPTASTAKGASGRPRRWPRVCPRGRGFGRRRGGPQGGTLLRLSLPRALHGAS